MAIMLMNKDKMVFCCKCGSRNTYNFNYAALNTKMGPFKLLPNDTLVYRFDNDNGNSGIVETITFLDNDFLDWDLIPTNQLVDKLNTILINGKAFNDFDSVMIQSNVSGATSCVEIIDGSARKALGYPMSTDHYCCGRLCLGYKSNNTEYSDVIVLRMCSNCSSQSTLFRNHLDHSNAENSTDNNHRCAVNSLALYLKQNEWIDMDMKEYYNEDVYDPAETIKDFPEKEIILFNYEDIYKK